MDVFPKTIAEFVRPNNWASDMRVLDKGGDGLIGKSFGGNDPNDTKWDTDDDGLSDHDETIWGTNLNSIDSDHDGISAATSS